MEEEGIKKFIESAEELGPYLVKMSKDGWVPEFIETYVKFPHIKQFKVLLVREVNE